MKLYGIFLEAYKDLKADKKKDPEKLEERGWIQIPKESEKTINNVIHITDQEGVDGLIDHLGEWQISSLNGGKIGKVGDRAVVFNGSLNKTFIGDGGTVVGDDGNRWYNPKNVKPEAEYDELIVIPQEVVAVYDISNMGDVVDTKDIYVKLYTDKKLN